MRLARCVWRSSKGRSPSDKGFIWLNTRTSGTTTRRPIPWRRSPARRIRRRLSSRGHAVRQLPSARCRMRASPASTPARRCALPGVKAILTADDLPGPAGGVADNGAAIQASSFNERALTNEPLYRGEPILAVAAVDELTAAEAIERIRVDYEPLPFNVDPIETLRPGLRRTHERPETSGCGSPHPKRRPRPVRPDAGPSDAALSRDPRTQVDGRPFRGSERRSAADGRGGRHVAPVVVR